MTGNERHPTPSSRRSPVPVIIVDKSLAPSSTSAVRSNQTAHLVPSSNTATTSNRGNPNSPLQKQTDEDRVAGRRLAFSQRAQSHIRLDDDTTSTTSTAPTLLSSTSSGFWSLSESSITFDPSSLRSGALAPVQRLASDHKGSVGEADPSRTPERRTNRSKSAPRPRPSPGKNAGNFQRVAQERRVRAAAVGAEKQRIHLRRADGRPLANRINAAQSRPRPTTLRSGNGSQQQGQQKARRRPSDVARIGQVPAVPALPLSSEQRKKQQQQPTRNTDRGHVSKNQQIHRPRAKSQTRPNTNRSTTAGVPASIATSSQQQQPCAKISVRPSSPSPHSQPLQTLQKQVPAHQIQPQPEIQERVKRRVSSADDTLSFKDFYRISQEIDRGSFSRVYECYHRYTAVKFAVKVIDRRSLSRKADDTVFREARILQELQNKRRDAITTDGEEDVGFVRLVDFFIEPTRFFLVMDFMAGSTLFDRVLDKHYYPEDEARILATRILKAVAFMHRHNVVHRDLKPQNILLADKDDDTNVFIGDFGFATIIRPVLDEKTNRMTRRVLRQKCGTPSYVAPEVIAGKPYDQAADLWSLGVIVFFVLGGYPPFVDFNSRQGLFRRIMHGEFEFHETDWSGVSKQAKDFISSLLTVDPSKRMSASQALFHPWILAGDTTKPPMVQPSAKDTSTTSKTGKGVRKAIKAAFKQSSSRQLQASGENVHRNRTASQ